MQPEWEGKNNFWFVTKIHSVQPCVGVDQIRVLEQVKAAAGELETLEQLILCDRKDGRTQNIFNSGFHVRAWNWSCLASYLLQ